MEWSLWDRWVIDGDVTVSNLDYFSEKKLSCYSVSCGQSLLYNSIFLSTVNAWARKLASSPSKSRR